MSVLNTRVRVRTSHCYSQRIRGFTTMRYINLRLTYLLTYLLTCIMIVIIVLAVCIFGYTYVWRGPICCTSKTPFTRYSRLSNRLYNRFDNAAVSCKQTSNRLSYRFDNRLDVCIHDTTGCQSGLTTGLTTGCIV